MASDIPPELLGLPLGKSRKVVSRFHEQISYGPIREPDRPRARTQSRRLGRLPESATSMIALLVKRFGVDLGSEDAEWLDVQSRRSPAGTNIESLVRQFRSEIDYVASLSYVYLDDDGEFVALEGEELERFERIEAKGLSDRFRSLLQYGLWTMSPDEESFLHWDTATGRMKAAIEDADVRWLLNSWLSRRILAALQAGDADNNR